MWSCQICSLKNAGGRLRSLVVVACESPKTKEKPSRVIPKMVALAHGSGRLHESFWLQSLRHNSNGVSQTWSLLELIAYESGRKESFDCIHLYCRYSENMLLWAMELSEVSGENALTLLTFITSDPTKKTWKEIPKAQIPSITTPTIRWPTIPKNLSILSGELSINLWWFILALPELQGPLNLNSNFISL